MKKILIICSLLLLNVFWSLGQTNADKQLSIKKKAGENVLILNGMPLSKDSAKSLMMTNDAAMKHMRAAYTNKTFANIAGCAGGFLIGWNLGSLIVGKGVDIPSMAVGAGLTVTGIVLIGGYNKRSKAAVEIYNDSLISTVAKSRAELSLTCTGSGLGVVLTF